jgi:glycosyltransferase involved in cell wall biosynthesis
LTPNVSVVIPAYNAARWLAETVQSVLGQSYADFEVIIVDDGSTDGTAGVAQSVADSRIRYIYQQNRGLSAARNAGTREARGRYIAFLDADDLFRPDKLARQVAVLDGCPEVGLVTCGFEFIDEGGQRIGQQCSWLDCPKLDLPTLLFWNPLLPSTLIVRREWCERAGPFDERLRRYEDWEYAIRLAYAGCRMEYVHDVLLGYRRHENNISTAQALIPVATAAALNVMSEFFGKADLDPAIESLRPKVFANLYLDAAARAYGGGLGERGREWLQAAISLDPDLMAGQPPRWLVALCGFALSGLVHDAKDYARQVVTYQPEILSNRMPTARQILTGVASARVFDELRRGHRQRARLAALHALFVYPSLIRNRGVLAVGFKPR